MTTERLQKALARAGVASRRSIEELIVQGRVTINGTRAELGDKVDLERDSVKVDGKRVQKLNRPHLYLMLNKPRGYVSTVSDPEGRPTVLHLLPPRVHKALFPVGRLDFDSEGLLLLTTDGEFAQKVAHPSSGCTKVYEVKVKGEPDAAAMAKLRQGIMLYGRHSAPHWVEPFGGPPGRRTGQENSWFRVALKEGRTRQIREMFFRIGHPVQRLKRVQIGAVGDPYLLLGDWRELRPEEVETLLSGQEPLRRKERKTRPRQRPIGERPAGERSVVEDPRAERRPAPPVADARPAVRPPSVRPAEQPAQPARMEAASPETAQRPKLRPAKIRRRRSPEEEFFAKAGPALFLDDDFEAGGDDEGDEPPRAGGRGSFEHAYFDEESDWDAPLAPPSAASRPGRGPRPERGGRPTMPRRSFGAGERPPYDGEVGEQRPLRRTRPGSAGSRPSGSRPSGSRPSSPRPGGPRPAGPRPAGPKRAGSASDSRRPFRPGQGAADSGPRSPRGARPDRPGRPSRPSRFGDEGPAGGPRPGGPRAGGGRPGGARPGGARPGGARPGGARPGGARPAAGRPGGGRPGGGRPSGGGRPGGGRPSGGGRPGGGRPGGGSRPGGGRPGRGGGGRG